jgi:hypothetical protein
MTNIKLRLARRGDVDKLVTISADPSNMGKGSLPWYLFGDGNQDRKTVMAAWEDAVIGFVYSTGGWYTCVVAEIEATHEVVGYCAFEWFEYDENGKMVLEKQRPARLQAVWDKLGWFYALATADSLFLP